VRAMVGGRDYGDSQFNRATDAMRQPGSSFKPIVYSTALASGKFHPDTVVTDAPVCIVNWCPSNYGGKYMGRVTLTQAITHSLNSVPVRLSIALGDGNPKAGRAKIIEMAKRLGITTELKDTQSLPIGAVEVTPLEITSVYAVFANGGRKAPPHAALDIMNPKGRVVYTFEKDGAPRPQPGLMHEAEGFPGLKAAPAVVLRALPHVPGIEMPAHQHDFFGFFPTGDFSNDVLGTGVSQEFRAHVQSHHGLLSTLLPALQPFRILDRDGRARNPRHRIRVSHRTRVRELQREGRD